MALISFLTKLTANRRWLVVAGILLLTGTRDLLILTRHPVAVGVDGYYYVLQVDHLLTEHRPYFPTATPLVLYVLTALSLITANTILAIKLGSVILHLLLACAVFFLVRRLTRNEWLGVLGLALCSFSNLHYYFEAEFISNMGALMLIIWCVWIITNDQLRPVVRYVAGAVTLLAAVISHQVAFFLALSAVLCLVLFHLTSAASTRKQLRYILPVLIPLGLWLLTFAVTRASSVVPPWIRAEMTTTPAWRSFLTADLLTLLIFALISLAVVYQPKIFRQDQLMSSTVGTVVLWTFLITLNPFLHSTEGWNGVVGRLRGIAYVQLAILAPVALGILWSWRPKLTFYAGAMLPAFLVLSLTTRLPFGLRDEYLNRRERLVAQLNLQRAEISRLPMIVAPHGDQFVVTAITGAPAQHTVETSDTEGTYLLVNRVPVDRALDSLATVALPDPEGKLLIEKRTLTDHLNRSTGFTSSAFFNANAEMRRAFQAGQLALE